MSKHNPLGLTGIGFVEFASPSPAKLEALFRDFGFSRTHAHRREKLDWWRQNSINLLLNHQPGSFGAQFANMHGPSIPSMGWLFEDAARAYREAIRRGARPYEHETPFAAPAIYGIGDSLIHFIEKTAWEDNFVELPQPELVRAKGFLSIDHLTNNVMRGTMNTWVDFYAKIFGFTEVRSFHIRGNATGLQSYALRSPDGSFCIPINEGSEEKSQIEEYLRDYKGAGVQHLAFLSDDLLGSLDQLAGTSITTLDIDDSYYSEAFQRVPTLREDKTRIREHRVLVDGDEHGYLLQIFTPPIIGPIFIELIQRQNHLSFGEGNFGALFRSMERDQERRGVL